MAEEFIPIVMFAGLTIVFCTLFWFRFRARSEMQQTIRLALDKGHELTPEIIDRLGHPKASKFRDLRLGVIWLSLAVGLALIGIVMAPDGGAETLRGCLAGAAFPLAIGLAYLLLYKVTGSKD